MVRNKLILLTCSIIFCAALSTASLAVTYLDVSGTAIVQPGANVTVSGSITNTTTSDTISGINVSARLDSASNSQVTGADGAFSFNITAPSTAGAYWLIITTNESSPKNKSMPVFVSNITGGSIDFVNMFPPFTAGTTFTINASLLQNGAALQNYSSNLKIFKANGPENGTFAGWAFTNLTPNSGSNGYMAWNITIPSSADGTFVIVLDNGAVWKIFSISAGYVVSASVETTAEETSSNFAPGSTVMIKAKVRDTSSNPATATSVTAYITLPNGTVVNTTLSAHPSYTGTYNNTVAHTTATGDYSVKIEAVVAGKTITGNAFYKVGTWAGGLETEKEFFMEWGGQAAFAAGSTVKLNIMPVNLTDGSIIQAGSATFPNCNSTYLRFVGVFYPNGTSANSTISGASFSQGMSMTNAVCTVRFTGPNATGVYGLRVNATIGGVQKTIEGYFSMQKYFLKAAAAMSTGGEMGFMSAAYPGSNVTFELSAYNITSQAQVSGSRITNIRATKIIPLEFMSGSTEQTNVTYAAETGSSPKIYISMPDRAMGPTLIQIEASIDGEQVRGDAFVVSNYLMGFLGPQAQGMGGGEMGGGGGMTSCSGTVTFSGMVTDVQSMTAAQGATAVGVIMAREELTGRDVSSQLSIAGATASNSNGQITVNVTFSGSLSGFYFMAFNASYQGKYAGIPSGFMCKNLNFWPQIKPAGGDEQSWRISPTSPVIVSMTNVTRINDSMKITDGNVTFPRIMNFNPSSGGSKMLVPTAAFQAQVNALNASGTPPNNQNNFTMTIYPQNFTMGGVQLTAWPNGFIDMQPQICSGSIGGACDTGFGGFQVVPFELWVEGFQWGSQVSAGSNLSYNVAVKANVSIPYNFTIKVGRPWEGSLTSVTPTSTVLLEDGWNRSSDWGMERWQVNFTLPVTTAKGELQVMITANGTAGNNVYQQADTDVWFTVTKYTATLPPEEGIYNMDGYSTPITGTDWNGQNTSTYGWNMTNITLTYGVNSSSNQVCVKNNLTVGRSGSGQPQTVVYSTNTKVMLVDRFTAGSYDTLLLNASGTIKVINATQRNFTPVDGNGALYLWTIEDCGFARIINTSTDVLQASTSNWAGDHQKSAEFVVPYVVKLGDRRAAGFTVDLNGVAKQSDGGWGYEGKLIEGTNYTKTAGTTDANGVGFLRARVNNSGRMVLFWKVNDSSDADIATMNTAAQVAIRSFRTYGDLTYPIAQGTVALQYSSNTQSVWNAFDPGQATYVYNGTVTETGANGFVRDNTQNTWYIVYSPQLNMTRLDTDTDFSNSQTGTYINQTLYFPSSQVSMGIANYTKNATPTGSMTFVYYHDSPAQSSPAFVSNATENITVKICASGFEKPTNKPKEGATVRLYTTNWFGPTPTTNYLQLYDPLTDEAIAIGGTVKAGPNGCAAIKVGPGQLSTWPTGFTAWIEADVTYGGDTEKGWGGGVFRGGAAGGSGVGGG